MLQPFGQAVNVLFQLPLQGGGFPLRGIGALFQPLHIRKDAFRLPPCLLQNPPCVLFRFPQGGFPLVLHLLAQLFCLIPQSGGFPGGFLCQLPLLFCYLPVILCIGNHILKADGFPAEQLLGVVNQGFGKPQLPADFKSVALSGNADGQPVGRPQGFHVKFHGSVLHPLGGEGKGLQLAVVGGGQGADVQIQQPLQNALCQCGALGRIRTCSQFVKEHQIPGGHLLHDFHNVGHMAGEGGQALLNGLFVPNVCKHLLEHRQLCAKVRRNLQPGLCHQGEQPYGFQGHGFAAGVGAGNHQGGEVPAHPQVGGHHLVRVNEGMSSPDDIDEPILVQLGGYGVHFPCQ